MPLPTAPALDVPVLRALAQQPTLGPWVSRAACADVPGASALFVDDPDPAQQARASTLCAACPVRTQCAAYAARTGAWGLWAGRWDDGKGRSFAAA